MIEKTHFNPKVPQYHNVYKNNHKNKKLIMFNGEKWVLEDQQGRIDDMVFTYENMLDQWCLNQDDSEVQKMHTKFNNTENEQEVEYTLYNNRDIVKETIKRKKEKRKLKTLPVC